MGEILADAVAFPQYLVQGRVDLRGARAVLEVGLDARGEVGHGIEQRAAGREAGAGIFGGFPMRRDQG
jgi:hypothetical protein